METSPAAQPAPDRRAVEEQAAGFGILGEDRDDARQETAEEQAARRRADEERADEEWAARRRAARQEAVEEYAPGLSISRKIMDAHNTATAVLESDAAFSKLAYGRSSSVLDLPFFTEEARLEREQYLARYMIAAGRDLLGAFTELLNTPSIWNRLASSERMMGWGLANAPSPHRARMELAELLEQHIPEVLLALGYRPPPQAEEWADLVQNPVQNMLSVGENEEAFASNSARAQEGLTFFNRRLRSCIEAAEASQEQDGREGSSRFGAAQSSLRTFVLAARNRAIPAALAAGVGGAVIGAPGGPVGMGIGALTGSAASLLTRATEAAATALLAEKGPQGDTPVMAAAQMIRADIEALDECVELIRSSDPTTIESIRFIIRRSVFQILQDAAFCKPPIRDSLENCAKALLSLFGADEFLTDEARQANEAHQVVDIARKLFAEAPPFTLSHEVIEAIKILNERPPSPGTGKT